MDLDRLEKQLVIEEGAPSKTYLDTKGILSGGIGHNLIAHPEPGFDRIGVIVPPEVRTIWFQKDIQDAINDLTAFLPWWTDLDDVRQNAMLDLCFNMGINGLLTFRNTLEFMKMGNYPNAANGLRHSQWAKDVGPNRAGRICAMVERGEWQ